MRTRQLALASDSVFLIRCKFDASVWFLHQTGLFSHFMVFFILSAEKVSCLLPILLFSGPLPDVHTETRLSLYASYSDEVLGELSS